MNCPYERVVIKVGSLLLFDLQEGVRVSFLKTLVDDVCALRDTGVECVIVSSGAIALGRSQIEAKKAAKLSLEEKQAAAACGQILLMQTYAQFFAERRKKVAQLLLTLEDSDHRARFLNASNTFFCLLERSIIPIVNENDTVATEEIRIGDNDRLAAKVAQMIQAQLLILLSDVDGLYAENPRENPSAAFIDTVTTIDETIESYVHDSQSTYSSGGMRTKIEAAKIATRFGCDVMIANGMKEHPLKAIFSGGRHTLFNAAEKPREARKNWIFNTLVPKGTVVVDEGAVTALRGRKSLLFVGMKKVLGEFERGDVINIHDEEGRLVGRGLVQHGSFDALRLIGSHSSKVAHVLGYEGSPELVHVDDMVLV